MRPTRPAPFDLSGGHPALDLVNTLDNRLSEAPRDLLADYADLLRFAEQARLLDASRARSLGRSVSPEAAARALGSARNLREELAAVLYSRLGGRAAGPADVLNLERHFQEASRQRELGMSAQSEATGEGLLHWQWGRSVTAAEYPVWLLAVSAAELLLSGAAAHVRACGAETCRWLFLDTSKNHTRRWCNMKVCGNRSKARRFQERRSSRQASR